MKAHLLLATTPQQEGTELEAQCHVLVPNAVLFDLDGDPDATKSTVLFCRVCVEQALERLAGLPTWMAGQYKRYGLIEGHAAVDSKLAG